MTEKCSCYNCRRPLEGIDKEHRYCWYCGATQMQSCPACGYDSISIFNTACPSCSQPFRYCPECSRLHPVSEISCRNNCGEGVLRDIYTGFTSSGVNISGNRSLIQKGHFSIDIDKDLSSFIPSNEEGFSKPACCYGIIFFAGCEGKVYGVNLVTGKRFSLGYRGHRKDLSSIEMKVLNSLLYFTLDNYVYGIDIVKREQIFCMKNSLGDIIAMKVLAVKESLFIIILNKNNELLFCKKNIDSLKEEQEITSDDISMKIEGPSQSEPVIAADDSGAYYADRDCNVWKTDAISNKLKLWENEKKYKRIIDIALWDGSLTILGIVNRDDKVCITYRENSGKRTHFFEGEFSKYRFIPGNLCVRRNYIYLCEPDRINIYSITSGQQRVVKINDSIRDPFIVRTNQGQYLTVMNIDQNRIKVIAFEGEAQFRPEHQDALPYNHRTDPCMFYGAGNIFIFFRNPRGKHRLFAYPFH